MSDLWKAYIYVHDEARFTSNRNIQKPFRWVPPGIYVVSALWKNLFGNIIKHTADLYEVRNQRLIKAFPWNSLCTFRDPASSRLRDAGKKKTKYLFTHRTSVINEIHDSSDLILNLFVLPTTRSKTLNLFRNRKITRKMAFSNAKTSQIYPITKKTKSTGYRYCFRYKDWMHN